MCKNLKIWVALGLSFLFVYGCGSDTQTTSKGDDANMAKLPVYAVQTADTIAPKDTVTPPEEGGYGFEELADSLGFVTYVVPEEHYQYFGHPKAKKGGMLTSVVQRFPATLRTEGQNSNYQENSTFGGLMYEGLVTLNPVTLDFMPALASHWKISDDKMQFWFRINPNARWSDGSEVTSEDVIATWDLQMDETILFPSSQLVYSKYERPEAVSKYIVTVKSKELNWRNFLYFGASMSILPAKHIGHITGTEYLEEYQYKVMPGTGPYTILEPDIKNQVSYALTRRTDYWAADDPLSQYLNNFDKIKFVVVKDNPTLEYEKFKKGEQDFYTVSQARRWVEETDFKDVEYGWIQKRRIFSQQPSGTTGYELNMREWPFNDRRIRYAFAYLFDRETLNRELFYDQYILQNSWFAGSPYENPNNRKITFDPEKAVELLAEAGWSERNSEGWLTNDKGEVFRIEIGIPKTIDYVITPYQQMLKDYGIDMQIKFVDGNALWKMKMERDFTITYATWGGLVFPNPETSLHSSLADKDNNNNVYGFKNERVDELCAIYDVEFDQQKRIEIIREIDRIVMEELPFILSHYAPYTRLMYWNKFGYPEYMVSRYTGDFRSIFNYWWIDAEKKAALEEAMKNDTKLPVGETEHTYWLDVLEAERRAEQSVEK